MAQTAFLLVSLIFLGQTRGADPTPESVLKAKSLKRNGTTYVLPVETEFQRKLNVARGLFKDVTAASQRKLDYERNVEDGRENLRQLEQQRVFVNQQLAQASTPLEHNRLVAATNALNGQINLLSQQASDPGATQALGAKLASRREDFIQAVLDLRPFLDKAQEQYAEAAKDPEIAKALESLHKTTKAKLTLGPSRSFLENVKTLEKVEASVLTESVELRKDSGVFVVDVTFNGKVTKPLIFDTGASTVVLPADLAAQIGLKPGPNDREVKAVVADGSEVTARMMTIPSLRVGKFTIKDVECVVMPTEKKNVPALLGQSFHKHFTYKFTPETGKLVLSKVETPEPVTTGSKTKTARKPGKTKKTAKTVDDQQPGS